MPGLVGIIGKGPGGPRRRELDRMLACMYKHGSMRSGSLIVEDLNVYAGWTCHRGSYADCLPVTSNNGDITILFGGEHYAPCGGSQERLAREHGRPFDKASALMPLYEEKGEDILPLLNGFFHGLIIDSRRRKVLLFNDRFGMQRLYYHEEPDALLFSSEAKSILAVRPALRAFDPVGLGEWLSCGCVLENRSLYKGVQVLPGGTVWSWDEGGSSDQRRYFLPESWEGQEVLETKQFYNLLRSTFREVLPDYFVGGDKIGLSTTGGLDTRMILANMGIRKQSVHCYSFSGPYRECLDASIGRKLAQVSGHPHTTIRLDGSLFVRFPTLAEKVVLATDGNLELSGVPNLFVNEMAYEISPIRLTGNYGSEVLRRHRAFLPTSVARRVLIPEYAGHVIDTTRTWRRAQEGNRLTFIAFKQVPWYSYNRLQAEQSILSMRSPFMDNALLKVTYQAPKPAVCSNLVSLRLIADGSPRLGRIMTDRGVTYPRNPSWPFTRAYYEFLFKMEYYAGHGMPRMLAAADKWMGPLRIERLFLGRNKYYHLRQWLRDELAQYVRDVLLDERAMRREYLDRGALDKVIRMHLSGAENHTYTISQLITLEIASRMFLDNEPPTRWASEPGIVSTHITMLPKR
jgi:asparagine synthase (glutamine-hydrolysing)